MSLSEKISVLKGMLDTAEKEIKALDSGRKAAAPRSRKLLQQIKTSSHELRKEITQKVKDLPVKKKVKGVSYL